MESLGLSRLRGELLRSLIIIGLVFLSCHVCRCRPSRSAAIWLEVIHRFKVPALWTGTGYLSEGLNFKNREMRRKKRRLHREGDVRYKRLNSNAITAINNVSKTVQTNETVCVSYFLIACHP